jgi:hypothetical protein
MKREDAVAPVIAAMLVLAVIVTFFAVWNASVIPSMKAQAEVSHLHDVEEGMLRFSSDIDLAASATALSGGSSSSMHLSEQIPLGGGDILYSGTKSGGALTIQDEGPYMRVKIYNASYPEGNESLLRLANISYLPAGNFWQNQSYIWSRGYVNVSNGVESVPLEYFTMQDVPYNIKGALFSASVGSFGTDPGKCSVIVVKGVNITPYKTWGTTSGNGMGTLNLSSSTGIPESFSNVTKINVSIRSEDDSLSGFPLAMHDAVNSSLANNLESICSNIRYDPTSSTNRTMTFNIDPVPSVTVIRQTTDITLSAR